MAQRQTKDVVAMAALAIAVWVTVQLVQYAAQVDSVDKTLTAQLMVYHQVGANAYRSAVAAELGKLGVGVADDQLVITEDRQRDEFRAEFTYEWPLRVLVFTFPRTNVARTRTTILDG